MTTIIDHSGRLHRVACLARGVTVAIIAGVLACACTQQPARMGTAMGATPSSPWAAPTSTVRWIDLDEGYKIAQKVASRALEVGIPTDRPFVPRGQ